MNNADARHAPGGARMRIEKDSDAVFAEAVRAGLLSEDPQAENFAGRYMYMHHDADGVAYFKHRETRAYVTLRPAGSAGPAGPADGRAGDSGAAASRPSAGEVVAAPGPKGSAGPGPGLWATVVLAGIFLAGALVDFDRGGPRVGTVRLDDLTAEFYAGAVRDAASPEAAAQAARDWGMRLEKALEVVAGRDAVVLFPVEAVAAGAADYTAEVRAAMRRGRGEDPDGAADTQVETGP